MVQYGSVRVNPTLRQSQALSARPLIDRLSHKRCEEVSTRIVVAVHIDISKPPTVGCARGLGF